MGKLGIICCSLSIVVCCIIVSCTGSDGEFIFNGSPMSLLEGPKEVNLTFPTRDPSETVSIKLVRRTGTIRPHLSEAIEFLKNNFSHLQTYREDVYDCKQFAYRVFDDAQKRNYESRYVIISLKGEIEGHALATIETADAGTLFVDFTPFVALKGSEQKPARTVAQVEKGKPYVRIPIDVINDSFRNSEADFEMYLRRTQELDREIEEYHAKLSELEKTKVALESKIQEFNARAQQGVRNQEDYQRLQDEQRVIASTVDEVNVRFDLLSVEEQKLRSNPYQYDWIGRRWVVNSVRLLP